MSRSSNCWYFVQDIVIRNLDYILTVSGNAVASASLDVLANLEKLLDSRSSELWSYRRLPTPTATFPAIIYSEDDDSDSDFLRPRGNHVKKATANKERDPRFDCFIHPTDDASQDVCKQVRALRKKLQQIEMLELKQSKGHSLDDQQIAKLQTKLVVESSLSELGVPVDLVEGKSLSSALADGKASRKVELSRKQRRNSKKKAAQGDAASGNCGNGAEVISPVLNIEILQPKDKVSFKIFYIFA